MGLSRPPDKVLLALFSSCLFLRCYLISSDHTLISSSGILCWDDCDEVVTRSSPVSSDVAKTHCSSSCSGCTKISASSGGSISECNVNKSGYFLTTFVCLHFFCVFWCHSWKTEDPSPINNQKKFLSGSLSEYKYILVFSNLTRTQSLFRKSEKEKTIPRSSGAGDLQVRGAY